MIVMIVVESDPTKRAAFHTKPPNRRPSFATEKPVENFGPQP